jgi:hypothetical protein
MQGRHDLRTFADGGGDALDRFRTDIADGENTAPARFQCMPVVPGILASQHKAFAVERDAGAIGSRSGNI